MFGVSVRTTGGGKLRRSVAEIQKRIDVVAIAAGFSGRDLVHGGISAFRLALWLEFGTPAHEQTRFFTRAQKRMRAEVKPLLLDRARRELRAGRHPAPDRLFSASMATRMGKIIEDSIQREGLVNTGAFLRSVRTQVHTGHHLPSRYLG